MVNCIMYVIYLLKEYGVWQNNLLRNIVRFLYKVQIANYCILFFYDFLKGIIRVLQMEKTCLLKYLLPNKSYSFGGSICDVLYCCMQVYYCNLLFSIYF